MYSGVTTAPATPAPPGGASLRGAKIWGEKIWGRKKLGGQTISVGVYSEKYMALLLYFKRTRASWCTFVDEGPNLFLEKRT